MKINSKKTLAAATALCLLTSSPVFAAQGDYLRLGPSGEKSYAMPANKAILIDDVRKKVEDDTFYKELADGKYINPVVERENQMKKLAAILAKQGLMGPGKQEEAKKYLKENIAVVQEALLKATEETPKIERPSASLKVASVSAINATTVEVELEAEKDPAPTAADFKVLVDDKVVEVTAVAKKSNSKKTYHLTIASLANKEGMLSVNQKAAMISGSDFGYDFKKPSIAQIVALDKDHINVVFSEKVDKTWAETAASYTVKKMTDGTNLGSGTPSLATLQADGKTVKLTLPTPTVTFENGYLLGIPAAKDVKGNTSATINQIFSGTGEASVEGPVVLSAVYTPATSATIVVKFDKDIHASVDKKKITVGGAALEFADQAQRTAAAELTITLSKKTKDAYEAAENKAVVFVEGAVKDTQTSPNNIVATTIVPVAAARLTQATYDESSNRLTFTFDRAIKVSTVDLSKVMLNGENLEKQTDSVNVLTQKSDSNTLEFTLSDNTDLTNVEAAVPANRALVFAAGFAKDINENAVAAATYTSVLTYVDDETAPEVTKITYNATTNLFTITANEEVSIPDLDKVALYDGEKKLFDFGEKKANIKVGSSAIANNAKSNKDNQFVLLFENGGANPQGAIEAASVNKNTLNLKFLKAGSTGEEGLKDTAGNILAKDTDVSCKVEYVDQDAVTLSEATQDGVSGDQVKLMFTKPVRAADLVPSKFEITKNDNPEVSVPVIAVQAYDNNQTVILTMDKNSPNYQNGYDYSVSSTVRDIWNNPYADPSNPGYAQFNLNTAVVATAYKLTAVTYTDENADFAFNAGDKLTLTFEGGVLLDGNVTAEDFAIVGAGNTLGTGFTVAKGSAPEKLEITLGTGAAWTFGVGSTFNITADNNKKHILGLNHKKVDAAGSVIKIKKPDEDKPVLTKAVYKDENGNAKIDQGDLLFLTFSENISPVSGKTINAVNSTASNADFIISVEGSTLDLDSASAQADGKNLTIALGSGATDIVLGTTKINGDQPDAIADQWGNLLKSASAAVIIDKFDTKAPTFSNVRIVKGEGNTGSVLEIGDKVVFDIDKPVAKDTALAKEAFFFKLTTEAIAKYGVDNSGTLGFGGDGNGASENNIVVDNAAKTVTITIADKDGWVGATIATLSKFNIDTVSKKALVDAYGNKIVPAAGESMPVGK